VTSSHTLFVDESGNAGVNYLDAAQPFHVAAGVLVRNERLDSLRAALHARLRSSETEFKGSNLTRSANGQRRVTSILTEVVGQHATPFFVVMERRFTLTAKLVDVFLDPAHQDAVDWLPTSAVVERCAITEFLDAKLTTATLETFARAYRSPSPDSFGESLRMTIAELNALRQTQLAASFQGALTSVERVCEAEIQGDESTSHAQWASLNLPAYMHLLRYVDTSLDSVGTYDVVHDATVEFEGLLREISNAFSVPGQPDVDLQLEAGLTYRGAFRNFAGFSISDSKTESALQAADLVASSVGRAARIAVTGLTNCTKEARDLCRLALSPLLRNDGEGNQLFAGVFTSPRVRSALFTALRMVAR